MWRDGGTTKNCLIVNRRAQRRRGQSRMLRRQLPEHRNRHRRRLSQPGHVNQFTLRTSYENVMGTIAIHAVLVTAGILKAEASRDLSARAGQWVVAAEG